MPSAVGRRLGLEAGPTPGITAGHPRLIELAAGYLGVTGRRQGTTVLTNDGGTWEGEWVGSIHSA